MSNNNGRRGPSVYRLAKLIERLGSRGYFLGSLWEKTHERLVTAEIKGASLTDKDRVLSIGCGSIPYTATIIARKVGARITAVDNDSMVVRNASSYLLNRGFGDLVKIEEGDALDYPISDYDVIIVSLGVMPRDLILGQLHLQSKNGTRIIYRGPAGILAKLWDEHLSDNLKGRTVFSGRFPWQRSVVLSHEPPSDSP